MVLSLIYSFNFRHTVVFGYNNRDESFILPITKFGFTIHRSQWNRHATCQLPHRTTPHRKLIRQYYPTIPQLSSGLLGGFGASAARRVVTQSGNTALLPCVYTFSKDYDTSNPYFPSVNESDSVRLDSTFQPDPPEGWFGLGNSSGIQPPILGLNYFQTAPWFHIAFDSGIDESDIQLLGSRNKANPVANPLGAIGALGLGGGGNGSNSTGVSPALSTTIDNAISGIVSNAANQTGWKGILGDIDPMLFFNITVNKTAYLNFINQSDSILQTVQNGFTLANLSATGFDLTGLQPLPWFNDTTFITDNDLDDLISNDILRTVHELSSVNASARGVRLGYWSGAITRYPAVANSIQVVSNMPWGVLRFSNVQNESYAYMIQTGTDVRLQNVASYPSEGLRRMAFQTMFSKAVCISPLCARSDGSEITGVRYHDNTSLQGYATIHQY